MSKHTDGKWDDVRYETGDKLVYISSAFAGPSDICDLYHRDIDGKIHIKPNAQANAKRIVACVNALPGISNEALESGVVDEMVEMIERIDELFDGDSDYEGVSDDLKSILSKLESIEPEQERLQPVYKRNRTICRVCSRVICAAEARYKSQRVSTICTNCAELEAGK